MKFEYSFSLAKHHNLPCQNRCRNRNNFDYDDYKIEYALEKQAVVFSFPVKEVKIMNPEPSKVSFVSLCTNTEENALTVW
jgi:hypothetical protein